MLYISYVIFEHIYTCNLVNTNITISSTLYIRKKLNGRLFNSGENGRKRKLGKNINKITK